MARKVLLLHGCYGYLEVSIAPSAPFLTMPMVVAQKKDARNNYYGWEALMKDETWTHTWLQSEPSHHHLLREFFSEVFQCHDVLNAGFKCQEIVIVLPQYLGPLGHISYYYKYIERITPLAFPIQNVYHASEVFLSSVTREYLGSRYSMNICGDFTAINCCEDEIAFHTFNMFTKVGFYAIVNLFIKLLSEKGYNLTELKDRIFCHKLIMDYCYVALDFEKELERIENLDGPLHEVEMKDGTVLELGKECIVATEVLFNPRLAGMDVDGIMSLFRKKLPDLRPFPPALLKETGFTLILAGSFTPVVKGLRERIQLELEKRNDSFVSDPGNFFLSNIGEDALHCSSYPFADPLYHRGF
mmetsp:Transcript_10419/g.13679  ORF Transcript_10419/g.13679 Transcript_10419/m.13679 type:complete len:357 (-) Transcript_10419:144-1214(-)